MPPIPGIKKRVKFSHELRGSFGRFKTDDSFRLQYLMTSVPIEEIDSLSTASELFRLEKIDFEELIQRDIDFARVQKIANEYLSRGKDRVVFFPPLLACVVLLEGTGSIKRKYNSVTRTVAEEQGMQVLRATWDDDGFELDLPMGDKESCTRKVTWNGENQYFYEFAAILKLNPARAKLVVLDGQHRLEAMRLLRKNPEQQSIIEDVEIPICLVWAPGAVQGDAKGEDMMRDFRELFVRVNSEPRKVSGHFITLLKDDSYSAMAARQLANKWKEDDSPGGWTRLHLLEWNTREEERVDLRTREFSITTISIISKTLEEHLFRAEIAPEILNLEERETDLQQFDSEFSWTGVVDKTHGSRIDGIIKEQIDAILVPALDLLFRSALPYARLEKSVGNAFRRLQEKVDENNGSFIRVKSLLGLYIYREEEMFEESARSAYLDFRKWIDSEPADKVYLLSVFQQALLRFWISISSVLKPYGLPANDAAKITLLALDQLCFKHDARFLSSERRYTRRMLWRNENVNFGSVWAKKAWVDLLGISLLDEKVRSAIDETLHKEYALDKQSVADVILRLENLGRNCAGSYLSRLREELTKETRLSVEEFFPEERASQLRAMKNSATDADRKRFELAIAEKGNARAAEAIAELADQLRITTDDLQRSADAG